MDLASHSDLSSPSQPLLRRGLPLCTLCLLLMLGASAAHAVEVVTIDHSVGTRAPAGALQLTEGTAVTIQVTNTNAKCYL